MIELHDLSIGYGDRTLLSEVEATIEKGKLTALIGRNGTGKSTLLRAIAGLNRRYSGRILLDGRPAADTRTAEMARTLAFVTTERTRIANLKCEDVVAIGRAPYTNWIGRMQKADTGKGSKIPAYLFLPGISAAKDIPQQIRMDMVVFLIGQCSIFELHTAVIDTCTDGRSEPFSDCETVRGFQASEEVFAAERCAEKGGRTPGNADKPVASPGCRKYHSVKIDGLYRLPFLRDIIVRCMLYSIHLYGLYTCLCLQRAKHGQYKKDLFRHIPMILFVILFDL